jgi:hypothetical protein
MEMLDTSQYYRETEEIRKLEAEKTQAFTASNTVYSRRCFYRSYKRSVDIPSLSSDHRPCPRS